MPTPLKQNQGLIYAEKFPEGWVAMADLPEVDGVKYLAKLAGFHRLDFFADTHASYSCMPASHRVVVNLMNYCRRAKIEVIKDESMVEFFELEEE